MTADCLVDENLYEINIKRGISPLIKVDVEPVGHWFHLHEYNRIHGISDINSDNSDDSNEQENGDIKVDYDIEFLKTLDHKNWKENDHYRVLGLQNYRFKATQEDIKKAHHKLALRCHPDGNSKRGGDEVFGNDFFTNITTAFNILRDPAKRKAFDSCDPDFDDSIPGEKLSNKSKFYAIFGPVFERNARWSVTENPPLLGTSEDSQETVESFYDFWYKFDSWREFSYLDEEDKEKAEDKDERRWMEKQNKAARLSRKKEENARILKLVDNAYKVDPRIAKFKQDERDRRNAIKKAKEDAIKRKIEQEQQERERKLNEEKQRKEKEEAELKERLAAEKKEREAMKKALARERRSMRTVCKENDYFITDERDRVQAMMDVETLCDGLALLQLRDIIGRVEEKKEDKLETRKEIKQEVDDLRTGKIENIRIGNMTKPNNHHHHIHSNGVSKPKTNGTSHVASEWQPDELQLLIKAVNLFPAGTAKRWDVVSQYLSQHGPNKTTRPSKEVLSKAKELQNADTSQLMKEAANKAAVAAHECSDTKSQSSENSEASQRLETPQEMLGMNLSPWSSEEQSLLEQALKTYSSNVADRWEKIASCVPGRSKKECMRRFKELAEMIKAKKAAMKAAGVKK